MIRNKGKDDEIQTSQTEWVTDIFKDLDRELSQFCMFAEEEM